jgi:3-(3-hydroxy-phenyl)propionate hydroxylase
VREKITDSMTPAIHRSALVAKPCRRPQLAGRLCPNPVLTEGKRFDDVVGARFAVVSSSPLTRPQHDEMTRRGAVVVSAEPGAELARWLRSGRATAAAVRPDRTVMGAGRNVGEVCRAVPVFGARTDA